MGLEGNLGGEVDEDRADNVEEPGDFRDSPCHSAKIQVCAERCVCTADQPQTDQTFKWQRDID
jgi:hypothetical protein